MPINFKQVLSSKEFLGSFNRWFIGTISLVYLGLAVSVTWTKPMWLILIVTYAQCGLIQLIKCKRPHLSTAQPAPVLRSTITNLALLLAILLALSYATVLMFASNPSWQLLQQLGLAALICGCLLAANLIVLKRLLPPAENDD
ncbi:hypothetical protein [Lactiplantibacillus pingfangensis]|uniref:hypothetical protein n=1 Tax=Lactiplantibacillus pingfangensis TaxID=2559915 RepID=UPI0010F7D81C|nr:hypothetical protein [Lactiplantibacillus pingfangensis]